MSFAEFLDDDTTSDATFTCSDGVKIEVHRVFLVKKSEEFKKIFAEMKQKHKRIRKLTDVDSETLKEILKFAYTGSTDIKDIQLIRKVYWAAVAYDIPELKLQCADLLIGMMNSENVLDILEITDGLRIEKVTEKCLQYIIK